MTGIAVRSIIVWFALIPVAMINGLAREALLTPLFGAELALPISGLTLSLLIIAVTWFCIAFIKPGGPTACLYIGLLWTALTLAFEYLFGHYVAGHSWEEIHRVFDIRGGNLFPVVLIATFTAPIIALKLRAMHRHN